MKNILKKKNKKTKKITKKNKQKATFSLPGLLIIAFVLILGILFVSIERSGKIDTYFEKKYP